MGFSDVSFIYELALTVVYNLVDVLSSFPDHLHEVPPFDLILLDRL